MVVLDDEDHRSFQSAMFSSWNAPVFTTDSPMKHAHLVAAAILDGECARREQRAAHDPVCRGSVMVEEMHGAAPPARRRRCTEQLAMIARRNAASEPSVVAYAG
jgi:hypothetical protein